MNIKPHEKVKVVIEIDKTAYNVLCSGVDADLVAKIYYKMTPAKLIETLICSSLPIEENEK